MREQDATGWLVLLMVLGLMGFGQSSLSVGHDEACGLEYLLGKCLNFN